MTFHQRLRNPAYTGDQRCLPCTLANLVLLALVAGAVAVGVGPLPGLAVGGAGLAAIWLRGYFVPFTPRFAPRLVDFLPVPVSGQPSEPASFADPSDVEGERVVTALVENGVLVPEDDELLLDPGFEDLWREEMDRLASLSPETLATEANAVTGIGDVSAVENTDQPWLAVAGRHTLIARPVAVAEVAALRALEPSIDDPPVRLAAAGPLRQFLERCPVCSHELTAASAVACCGGHTNPRDTPAERRVCPNCEQEIWRTP